MATERPAKVSANLYYRTLIPLDACLRLYRSPDWVVVDCRFELADRRWGEGEYRQAHVPGAVYADLERDLSGVVDGASGRHPLPDWRRFADCLGRWGIHPDTQVVVYDQGGGAYAARLWWMLRAVGHQRVALMEGGWAAWLAAGGACSADVPAAAALSVICRPGSGWVTTEEVQDNLRQRRFLLVDARAQARFAGEREPIDPVAGHVPGAINRPFEDSLRADGRFLEVDALRADWLARLGDTPAQAVVHMCGSGVTACHNLLSMEHAGLAGSRLYPGSWSEWVRDAARPVATVGD